VYLLGLVMRPLSAKALVFNMASAITDAIKNAFT
jgi:hypothetical protein